MYVVFLAKCKGKCVVQYNIYNMIVNSMFVCVSTATYYIKLKFANNVLYNIFFFFHDICHNALYLLCASYT